MNNPAKPDPWIGRLIGDRQRYRLEKRIGAGGMGDVFLAMDTLLGKQVALKLLKETLVAEALRKRFEREVAICAALKSNHIVEVSDYGVTPEGHAFFVMEYLRGESLGQLLRRDMRLSVSRTVGIISQVCEGLRLAHAGVTLWRKGATVSDHVKVVHRDLKPDNIFLVPTALGDLVKILDFGVAKIRSEAAEYTNLTGMFIGTFHYAAPEQLVAEENLDGRADIYSLGVILYEMISGTDPFGLGLNKNNISGASWALAHTSKQPIPLLSQPGCEQLPPELEAVVMRCLQKAPDDRFASVDELQQALQAAAAIAQTPSPPRQAVSPDPTMLSLREGLRPTARTPDSPQTQAPQGQGSYNSTIYRPLTHSERSNSLSNNIDRNPDIIPSNSLSRPKSPLLLIGSGIAISVALILGIYYLPQLFNQPTPPEAQPILQEPKFSLANTLAQHSGSVWSVAISPDGQILASGSEDKTVKIWRLSDRKVLRTFSGRAATVRSAVISPDGQSLASGWDNNIKLWRLNTGEQLQSLSGHSNPVWSVAISPDGQTLVSSSFDGIIKVWSLGTGKQLHTLSGHSDTVWSVAISPDGQTFASGSQDKTIKIWRLGTGELLRTISGDSAPVRAVAISPDGQSLASGSGDNIKIWNLNNGKLLSTLSGHTDRVVAIAISPDGQTLVSGSLDKTIKIWRLDTGELLSTLSGHSDWVLSVAFSPDGQTLVSGSKDRTIKIWQR